MLSPALLPLMRLVRVATLLLSVASVPQGSYGTIIPLQTVWRWVAGWWPRGEVSRPSRMQRRLMQMKADGRTKGPTFFQPIADSARPFSYDPTFLGPDLTFTPLSRPSSFACRNDCRAFSTCTYFVFDTAKQLCWFKSDKTGEIGRAGMVSGDANTADTCFEYDTVYHGDELPFSPGSLPSPLSPYACQQACGASPLCQHFTTFHMTSGHNSNSGNVTRACHLLKTRDEGKSMTLLEAVSGPKKCPGIVLSHMEQEPVVVNASSREALEGEASESSDEGFGECVTDRMCGNRIKWERELGIPRRWTASDFPPGLEAFGGTYHMVLYNTDLLSGEEPCAPDFTFYFCKDGLYHRVNHARIRRQIRAMQTVVRRTGHPVTIGATALKRSQLIRAGATALATMKSYTCKGDLKAMGKLCDAYAGEVFCWGIDSNLIEYDPLDQGDAIERTKAVCARACALKFYGGAHRCQGFLWQREHSYCILAQDKEVTSPRAVDKMEERNMDFYEKVCDAGRQLDRPLRGLRIHPADRWKFFKQLQQEDVSRKECQSICCEHPLCRVWLYNKRANQCFLRHARAAGPRISDDPHDEDLWFCAEANLPPSHDRPRGQHRRPLLPPSFPSLWQYDRDWVGGVFAHKAFFSRPQGAAAGGRCSVSLGW
ncbi:unnamed protein product [Vitrella brassicaformis CCMP3155]|uniref:Apple domain-containing protein n=2 Tax=Vitrella brassicaformis TaxID=1169539 RepID=A0A0G4FKH8_VITBC|nr:unnamed protein product [Vitrella brassicaformis CCMP3155]|eukprot:CEM14085.1 unnamed protein product [Vitrella brassicaformis CCMP3155]